MQPEKVTRGWEDSAGALIAEEQSAACGEVSLRLTEDGDVLVL